ncbi:MAG: DNA polymerase III subunit delta [Planctomycetota bacterium]|nr:DNA polymerase III subunit delta [Planctomycetota bacterium]
MSNTVHAFDFLDSNDTIESRIIVLFGEETFLKSHVSTKIRDTLLQGKDSQINFVKLTGNQVQFKDIYDELDTVSLFGGGQPRVVFVDDADAFVSDNRSELEDYVAAPSNNGILVLDVGQWRSNTRLYKAIDQLAMQIDCRAPMRGKSIDQKKIAKWISSWGKQNHHVKIKPRVSEHLIDLAGAELGVLDQNLAKLALFFEEQTEITEDDINEHIGGWQAKTIWDLIDSAIAGHPGRAISQLDKLLQNGEVPIALYGQIGWSLRRYAHAFDEAQWYRRNQQRMNVEKVMEQAGFRFPPERKKAIGQLKNIGREKGGEYYRILLECDLALKASHSSSPRSRIALEKLIFELVEIG